MGLPALGQPGRDEKVPAFCDACFSGDYPITLTDHAEPREAQLSLLAELA
jgi:amidophosphoribosyltransferase (EC 2.4.2.14)